MNKAWKAYVFSERCDYCLMEATTTDTVIDGVEMVRHGSALVPITEGWRMTQTEAKADAAMQMAVLIGKAQAKLDALREEILHEHLTSEEVQHGVA